MNDVMMQWKQAVISPTFCGFWLILLVSTDSMASLAPTYSTPEERSRRKVLKLPASLNTSGPRSLGSGQGNRGRRCQCDCQSSEVSQEAVSQILQNEDSTVDQKEGTKHFSQKKV